MYRHYQPVTPAVRRGINASPGQYAPVPGISFAFGGFGPETGFSGSGGWGKTRLVIRVPGQSPGPIVPNQRVTSGGSRMGEFAATLQHRLREAHASLRAALAAGDADLTDTQLDEIEHLNQIAAAHGLPEAACA